MSPTVPDWAKSREWSEIALASCLDSLRSGRVTETHTVRVIDSWAEDGIAICVVYEYPYFDGVLGIRRTFDEDMNGDPADDPEQFGRDVASFDIGEPLGRVVERLRHDVRGVSWWGDLDRELPRKPGT